MYPLKTGGGANGGSDGLECIHFGHFHHEIFNLHIHYNMTFYLLPDML